MKNGLVIDADGTQTWWVDDQLHRVDRPAWIGSDGTEEWWVNDQLHRTDGPAVIYADGTKYWCVNDQLHRVDGPAVIWADGTQTWWVRGVNITEEVESWMQANDITLPFDNSVAALFCMIWG